MGHPLSLLLHFPSPETNSRLHRYRDLEAELGRLLLKQVNLLLAVSVLVVLSPFVDVSLTKLQHPINESCQAVSHSSNSLRCAELCAQTTVLGSQVAPAADQIPGRQPQCCGGAVDHMSRAFAQQLVTADAIVRT